MRQVFDDQTLEEKGRSGRHFRRLPITQTAHSPPILRLDKFRQGILAPNYRRSLPQFLRPHLLHQ
jgi:hypothetical protein